MTCSPESIIFLQRDKFLSSWNKFFYKTVLYLSFHWLNNSWIRGFEPVTHRFKLVTCEFELVTRGFKLVTREFEGATRKIELVSRKFELVEMNS